MSDIEIARKAKKKNIREIADELNIREDVLYPFGHYTAKIDFNRLKKHPKTDSKLILVTAITPTPAGEGKTTTAVGLTQSLGRLGKKVVATLREPSLGPIFGIKGGGEGGRMGAPPALAGAVEDALKPLGVKIDELPLTPRHVRALVRAAAASKC